MTGKDARGRFQTGSNGGPGRPQGSKNKLSEKFLAALLEDFEEHGASTIASVRDGDPAAYVRIVASLVPKDFEVAVRPVSIERMSDDELMAIIAQDRARLDEGDA